MSILSSALKKLKPLGHVVNSITDFAATPLGYIPGVGPEVAGLVKGLGDLAGSKNLKTAALNGLKTGGQAFIGGKIAGKLGGLASKALPVLSKGDMLKNGATKVIGYGPNGVPLFDQNGAMAAAQGGGGGGLLGAAGGLLKGAAGKALGGSQSGGGIDWGGLLGTAAKVALPAAGAYSAAKQQGKADELRDKALKLMTDQYATQAPLRSLGMSGLTDPRVRDLSSVFAAPPQAPLRRVS